MSNGKFRFKVKSINMKSIRSRLVLAFIIALVVPGTLIGYFSYQSAKTQLVNNISSSAQNNVDLIANTINTYLEMEMKDVSMLSQQLSSQLTATNNTNNRRLLDDFINTHPELELLVLGNEQGEWMKAPDPGKQDYDPRTRDWYKLAKQSPEKVVVSDPYVSVTTNNMVVSIAKVTKDGNGVISFNLSLSALANQVKDVTIGSHGYIYIFDRNSKFITHPKYAAGSDAEGEHYSKMLTQDHGMIDYSLDGNHKRATFTTSVVGWKIVGTMEYSDITESTAPIKSKTIIVIVIAIIMGLILTYFITESISKPLQKLMAAAARISRGDLTERVQTNSKDELGQLAVAFNAMTESLHSVLQEVVETSSQLAASSEEMIASAEQTAKASEHITTAIQEVAVGMDAQSQSANETASTMEDMTIGIQRIAESASLIVESSTDTRRDVSIGRQKMQEVTSQMVSIRESVNDTSAMISKLSELSSTIKDMNAAIADMSSQTNLLSLNAAIEAARAGENGRGFAVVANEVRKLADQSKDTVDQILNVIIEMVMLMEKAKGQMVEKTQEAEQGIEIVNEAEEAFQQMEKSTQSIAEQIIEISAITEQMSASTQQIAASVEDIASVAKVSNGNTQNVSAASEEQLASMEEVNQAAQSLTSMAEKLQSVVDRFKL
ncbi:methyl-accepting chemotaxis protein [Cohnella mopanensis]|uniref:methyl-accepting chemotaxis protein n=1 Tax=Cohnella mopanensis TaxID=2911966 RepID=UPI001EF958D5|nr:methyl-accepting chemotaxis protein [Cohnella mopanensis]